MKTTVQSLLKQAESQLKLVTTTPKLEAEILLAEILQVSRSYLHAYPEQLLTAEQLSQWQRYLARRLAKEPLPYIIGKQAFWDLELYITPDVLIPRPETELLVEIILQEFAAEAMLQVVDLGTGSGAIALALAKHRPRWQLYALDQSEAALQIAAYNAQRLQLQNISFIKSHWCENLPAQQFDIIVSNPPYIEAADRHLAELQYEPTGALIAGQTGLEAFQAIVPQARRYLKNAATLLLEHGYQQAEAVGQLLQQQGYYDLKTYRDLQGHPRISTGRCKA